MADGFDAARDGRSPLNALDFSELFFSNDFRLVQMRCARGQKSELVGVPDDCKNAMHALAEALVDAFERPVESTAGTITADMSQIEAGAVRIVSTSGLRFKAHRIDTIGGHLYHCRRMKHPMPNFAQLTGIPESVRKHMLMFGRPGESGLLLFSGLPGAGKTTTMLSYMVHTLRIHGNLAALIEREPEYRLNGAIADSKGRIVQMAPSGNGSATPEACAARLRSVLAMAPRYAAIGQASTAADARLALDLAMAGVMTFTTIDATDIISAVSNLVNKASEAMPPESAREAVALSLRGCLHQALGDQDGAKDPTMRRLRTSSLFLSGSGTTSTIASKIKSDTLARLASDISVQESRALSGLTPLEIGTGSK